MSKSKLVLLAVMLAVLVLGTAIPVAAQLNTGNVRNIQGVLSDGSPGGDTSLTVTNSDSAADDTGLTGTNTGSTAGNGTDVETCTGESIELNADEKRMLDLHNQARADQGLPTLCVHPALTEAARFHSQEMLDKGYFSHDSFNKEDVETRLQRLGYPFAGYSDWTYGENITWGSGDMGVPDHRFKEWMDSADHRANILNKDFHEIGIGAREGTYEGLDGSKMYTVDFGTWR